MDGLEYWRSTESNFIPEIIHDKMMRLEGRDMRVIEDNGTLIEYYKVPKKVLLNIIKGINFVRNLLDNRGEFRLTLLGFDDKKRLPKSEGEMLREININSGVSVIKSNMNGISLVYRREEMLKVAIHETLHAMGFDNLFTKVNNRLYNEYKNAFEGATEALATIIALKIIYPESKTFNREMLKQIKFSLIQSQKVQPWINKTETNLKEYYILKTHYLLNVNDFMNELEKSKWNPRNKNFMNWTTNIIKNDLPKINTKKFRDKSLKMTILV